MAGTASIVVVVVVVGEGGSLQSYCLEKGFFDNVADFFSTITIQLSQKSCFPKKQSL